ncbi:MAG TPA: DASS family sodium-coupled anion symporter [Cyclobacteriaceae bacterium]|nr:DASS family sodium-coupled anion symporter [Cyclobacteriaceae bacterium]
MSKLKLTGFVLGPLLFLIVFFLLKTSTDLNLEACKVLGLAAWMVSWWVTEAVHVSVTALVPMAMLPILGVMSIREATSAYGDPVIYLFMGGFMLALGLEKHNLHQRIALNLIKRTGTSGNGIIAGFMLATGFISMWISNTATAIMMLPIAVSVTKLLGEEMFSTKVAEKNYKNFATGLMLSIAYAASVGGMATIIGTPPNVVMVGLYRQTYYQDITFLQWFKVGLPVSVVIMTLCYLMITRLTFPNHIKNVEGSAELINDKLSALGRISRQEKFVLVIFFLTSFCWIFRPFINDWLSLLFYDGDSKNILDDTVIAIAGGLLMFAVPVNVRTGEFIITWEDTKKLPWGILILFGGGMCLAKSMEEAGLIQRVGEAIANLGTVKLWVMIVILTSMSLLLTEFMSNVALTTIFVPVVFGIANAFGFDPLSLAMAVTFAASCAFTLPVSTPPNAILFASGHIQLSDMIRAGILLDIFSLIIIAALSLAFI